MRRMLHGMYFCFKVKNFSNSTTLKNLRDSNNCRPNGKDNAQHRKPSALVLWLQRQRHHFDDSQATRTRICCHYTHTHTNIHIHTCTPPRCISRSSGQLKVATMAATRRPASNGQQTTTAASQMQQKFFRRNLKLKHSTFKHLHACMSKCVSVYLWYLL